MNVSSTVESPTSDIQSWVLATRPKTLVAGVAPVLLGSALAFKAGSLAILPATLCLLFAVFVQIGCNFANDYFDFVNGVDTKDRVGPKRAVASGLIAPDAMKIGTIAVLSIAFLIGSSLAFFGGWSVILLAFLSVVCAVAYTAGPFPLGYHGLGSLFVLIFFGFVATMYTFYLQTAFFSLDSFWVALAFGLMAVNLREVNDVRDIDTDSKAGKKTMAVRFGKQFVEVLFLMNYAIALAVPVLLALQPNFNPFILLPLLTIPLGLYATVNLMQASTTDAFHKTFSLTIALLLSYAALFTIGIALS